LLHHGKILKKQGNPVGIAISHCADANTTFWSVLWCYGGKVLEADGKTPAINSDKTVQVIEWYKELYHDAMEPEVLSWDDASNNRRSEEHTSELQSRFDLVCRLLLEKKNTRNPDNLP